MLRDTVLIHCTYLGCDYSFLLENEIEWKRHEQTQHFQPELWKCGVIPPNSSSLCGKLSFRRQSHTTHLRDVHGITDNEIAIKTEQAHIGRDNFKSFWCGFCPSIPGQEDSPRGRVIPLNKKGPDGWDERFGHLKRHFTEDGYTIDKYEFLIDDGGVAMAGPMAQTLPTGG